MVVQLDTHQSSGEPFGLPWTSLHTRRADSGPSLGNSSKSRFFRASASAPSSPPSVFQVLKGPVSSSSGSGSGNGSGISNESSGSQNAGRRLAKIQVEIQPCQSPTVSPTPASRPTPKKSISAPVVPQCPSKSSNQRLEQSSDSNNAPPSPPPAKPAAPARPLTETVPTGTGSCVKEATPKAFCFAPSALAAPSGLALRPAKRGRALHDVDGPGTGGLPCKKRRLRLHLVTSRLSQPYSWPATHILNRESGDDAPMLSRFLKFAAMGVLKKAGHQSSLVRKAAILNRVRIGVRQAAVLRGHTVLAGMAARGNSLSHGLQLVTTSSGATSARFPGNAPPYDHPYDLPYPIPPIWRPHTTAFHPSPSSPISITSGREGSTRGAKGNEKQDPSPMPTTAPSHTPPPSLKLTSPPPRPLNVPSQREEEEDVAFPSPDLETRYTDFSDDDMDDVYADFGVLFGSGSGSPENGSGSIEGTGGEHYYEEYLDELDGLRWVA